jgi:hypothetical protein
MPFVGVPECEPSRHLVAASKTRIQSFHMGPVYRRLLLSVLLVLLAAPAGALSAKPQLPSQNNALVAWLPRSQEMDLWNAKRASETRIDDSFTYAPRDWFGGPADGRTLRFGNAGSLSASVVYDAHSKTAFYDVGCCSWRSTLLVSGVAAPPQAVRARDLGTVGTKAGARLGESSSAVRGIYGAASVSQMTGKPGYTELTYYKPQNPTQCYWYDYFIFLDDKLVSIELAHAC